MSPKRRTTEGGAVAVEAALTLVLFFTLLLAIMEGSRFLNVQQTLTNAAREGARMAVAPLTQTSTMATDAEIDAEVTRFLNAANISGATVTVQRPLVIPANGVPMEWTRVTTSVNYQVFSLATFSNLSVTLTGQAVMRNETSP